MEWKPGQANIAPAFPFPSRRGARVHAASGAHAVAATVADGKLLSWVRGGGVWARLEDVPLGLADPEAELVELVALPSGSAVACVADQENYVIKLLWLDTAAQ